MHTCEKRKAFSRAASAEKSSAGDDEDDEKRLGSSSSSLVPRSNLFSVVRSRKGTRLATRVCACVYVCAQYPGKTEAALAGGKERERARGRKHIGEMRGWKRERAHARKNRESREKQCTSLVAHSVERAREKESCRKKERETKPDRDNGCQKSMYIYHFIVSSAKTPPFYPKLYCESGLYRVPRKFVFLWMSLNAYLL